MEGSSHLAHSLLPLFLPFGGGARVDIDKNQAQVEGMTFKVQTRGKCKGVRVEIVSASVD